MSIVFGDQDLSSDLQRRLGRRHPVFGAATIVGDRVTLSGVGARVDAPFEIGSISKALTGLLYVDALERGEVLPGSTLGDLLPVGGVASGIRLDALSTHSSGLPSLPRAMAPLRRSVRLWTRGTNPYGDTRDELLKQTGSVALGSTRARYSNLGFQLLGHAVAAGAGMPYRELLSERLALPLALTTMDAPSTAAEIASDAVRGRSRSGREREPWTGEGIAPAGGIRASVEDLATLARAVLVGTAPGTAALDPVANFSGQAVRIGAGWLTLRVRGRDFSFHNGMTGGFASFIGLDREAGTAVVVLTATAASVDRHGFAVLEGLSG